VALWYFAFVVGALVSLATSWLLVTRLERIGERFGFSEALLGVAVALAADAPEITSAIAAIGQHERSIGAGVVIGSNVFNLAALLGLGAIVAGFIALHRRVVVFAGVIAMVIALCATLSAFGTLDASASLGTCAILLGVLFVGLGVRRDALFHFHLPKGVARWIAQAIDEEEIELAIAIRPTRAKGRDIFLAPAALIIVVIASVAMERGASHLGHHFHIANVIIGALILAAVTSLPNVVAAVYLAARGRGAAALSTALNSNNLNVVAGLLIPGSIIGLGPPNFPGELTALSYLVLTLAVLIMAFALSGLNRRAGAALIIAYVAFAIWLVAVS
jgi:cation:H+ antiporter